MAHRELKPEAIVAIARSGYLRAGLRPGAGVLVAASGGADSTALLIATAVLSDPPQLYRLEVASIDHGLSKQSKQWIRQVAALAERHGLPFHPVQLKLAQGPGVEARARDARYAALEEVRA